MSAATLDQKNISTANASAPAATAPVVEADRLEGSLPTQGWSQIDPSEINHAAQKSGLAASIKNNLVAVANQFGGQFSSWLGKLEFLRENGVVEYDSDLSTESISSYKINYKKIGVEQTVIEAQSADGSLLRVSYQNGVNQNSLVFTAKIDNRAVSLIVPIATNQKPEKLDFILQKVAQDFVKNPKLTMDLLPLDFQQATHVQLVSEKSESAYNRKIILVQGSEKMEILILNDAGLDRKNSRTQASEIARDVQSMLREGKSFDQIAQMLASLYPKQHKIK